MRNKNIDGFSIAFLQDEDGEWVAYFEELPEISAIGANQEEACMELSNAWVAVKASLSKHNKPIPVANLQRSAS